LLCSPTLLAAAALHAVHRIILSKPRSSCGLSISAGRTLWRWPVRHRNRMVSTRRPTLLSHIEQEYSGDRDVLSFRFENNSPSRNTNPVAAPNKSIDTRFSRDVADRSGSVSSSQARGPTGRKALSYFHQRSSPFDLNACLAAVELTNSLTLRLYLAKRTQCAAPLSHAICWRIKSIVTANAWPAVVLKHR
jgi:hypothetical protein